MQRSEAWPALRGTGVASLRQQPLSPSLLFLFFELLQHGIGEDAEVCRVRGAAVRRPVRAALYRHAAIRRHCSKGQNTGAASWRRQHGLLAHSGLLHCLCDLYCPAGLGTPEVYGLHEEEVSHWAEEMVSFFCLSGTAGASNGGLGCAWSPAGTPATETWAAFLSLNRPVAGLTALGWWISWVSKSHDCLCLPSLLFCVSLPLCQEARGPRLCDPVNIALLCLSHRQLGGITRCRLSFVWLHHFICTLRVNSDPYVTMFVTTVSLCRSFVVISDHSARHWKQLWDRNDAFECRWCPTEWNKREDLWGTVWSSGEKYLALWIRSYW